MVYISTERSVSYLIIYCESQTIDDLVHKISFKVAHTDVLVTRVIIIITLCDSAPLLLSP